MFTLIPFEDSYPLVNGIRGVYHQVGKGYLQDYLNEYSFHYNWRFDEQPMFLSFLSRSIKVLRLH